MTTVEFRPEVGEWCRIKMGDRLIKAIPSRVVMNPPANAGVDSRHFNVVYYPHSQAPTMPELAEGVIASRLYPRTGMASAPAEKAPAPENVRKVVSKATERPAKATKAPAATRTKAAAAPSFSGVAELLPGAPAKKAPAKKTATKKAAPKKAPVMDLKEDDAITVKIGNAQQKGIVLEVGATESAFEGKYYVMYGPRDRKTWVPAANVKRRDV